MNTDELTRLRKETSDFFEAQSKRLQEASRKLGEREVHLTSTLKLKDAQLQHARDDRSKFEAELQTLKQKFKSTQDNTSQPAAGGRLDLSKDSQINFLKHERSEL